MELHNRTPLIQPPDMNEDTIEGNVPYSTNQSLN